MAWTPPTKAKFTPGEIPHKRQVSAQERANLEANAPELMDPSEFVFGIVSKDEYQFDDSTVDADIIEVLDEMKAYNIGIGSDVFDEDLDLKIEDYMLKLKKSFDIEEAMDVAVRRELKMSDFYFGIGNNHQNGIFCIIVPKRVWDTTYHLEDKSWAKYFIPDDMLIEFEPCKFHFAGDWNADRVRRKLTELGAAENKDMRF